MSNALLSAQHLVGLAEIDPRQSSGSQRVHCRHREQGGAHAVPAHVEQIDGKAVFVEPPVPETVSAQLRRALENPVRRQGGIVDFFRQEARDVVFRLVELLFEGVLALLEARHGVVELAERRVRPRMVAHARENLELVGEFHHIVVRPVFECAVFYVGLLFGGQDYEGNIARFGAGAEKFYEGQPVDLGHYEVLEYDGWAAFFCGVYGAGGVRAVKQRYVGLAGEHPLDRFGDDFLVVDEQRAHFRTAGRRVFRCLQIVRHLHRI